MSDLTSLKKRIQELEDVHRVAESLNALLGVHEILEAITTACVKICKAERGSVVLFSSSSSSFPETKTLVRSFETSGDKIHHAINRLTAGWILARRKPLLTENILAELKIKGEAEEMPRYGPALALPLTANEKIIGIINLVNLSTGRRFTEDDLRVGSIVAPLAAHSITRAEMLARLNEDNKQLVEALSQQQETKEMLGGSQALLELRRKIALVAPKSATVLLVGETGTGKEIVARTIHHESSRAGKPFIPVNCSAIPEHLVESELFGHERGSFTGATELRKGRFEMAHGGTIFLDEVSAMPLELQPKLLRVLEERSVSRVGSSSEIPVDVRVIVATNKDLRRAIDEGTFREDLYQRINVVPIALPPLRDRGEDIPLLAQAFLRELGGPRRRFAQDALEYLSGMKWKGNVRELRNLVERVSILTSQEAITSSDIRSVQMGYDSAETTGVTSVFQRLLELHDGNSDLFELAERQLISLALKQRRGNATHAAKLLGIGRNALLRRVRKYHLDSR